MRISSKLKNAQIVYQTDFSGGLNTSVPSENIAANELGVCDNFEIPVGATILRTRSGVASVAASVPIAEPETFLPVTHAGETKFLISAGQKIYLISALGVSTEYDLNGAKVPTFAKWGEEPLILIASGDKLQSLDLSQSPAAIAEVDSPIADIVFVWNGRVGIARAGTDRITLSGIGDHTNWQTEDIVPESEDEETDEWTEADSIWADIGWKAGGDILAVAPVGENLAVIKSEGMAYVVSGYFPDWYFPEVSRNVATWSRFSHASGYGDLLFLDPHIGVCSFSDMQKTRAARPWESGMKVNNTLKSLCDIDARAWFLPSRQQFLFRPTLTSRTLYVFTVGLGWCTWTFPFDVRGVAEHGGAAYILLKTTAGTVSVGALDETAGTDLGTAITATATGKGTVLRGTVNVFHTWARHRAINAALPTGAITMSGSTLASLRQISDGETATWQNWIGEPAIPGITATGGRIEIRGLGMEVGEI